MDGDKSIFDYVVLLVDEKSRKGTGKVSRYRFKLPGVSFIMIVADSPLGDASNHEDILSILIDSCGVGGKIKVHSDRVQD